MKFLKGLALRSATLHSAQGPLNDSKTVYTIYFILPIIRFLKEGIYFF